MEIESNIEEFKNIVNKSNSYADLSRYYGFGDNGEIHKYFRNIIEKNNISIFHWQRGLLRRKYKVVKKECPICKSVFTTQLGHKKEAYTCSCKCSNIYFSSKRHTDDNNKKISKGIKQYLLSIGKTPKENIKCVICGKEKTPKRNTQKCCSNKCAAKLRGNDPVYIAKLKAGLRKCVDEGRHKGWNRHTIGQTPSYAEIFFMKVLSDYHISYQYDKSIGKYYVDFALGNKNIALEIDGKQHKQTSLIVRDNGKDKYLSSIGWKVYRIDWNCINNDAGKALMKEKIQKFLGFYYNTLDQNKTTNIDLTNTEKAGIVVT
jgi:very-short-patch-repair endonuclease